MDSATVSTQGLQSPRPPQAEEEAQGQVRGLGTSLCGYKQHQEGQVGKVMGGSPGNSQGEKTAFWRRWRADTRRQLGRGWAPVCRRDAVGTETAGS